MALPTRKKSAHKKQPGVLPEFRPAIVLEVVPFHGKTLRFRQPLLVTPQLEEDGEIVSVEIPELRIIAWGKDWAEFLYDLADEIHAAWKMYALRSDDELYAAEQDFKRTLRKFLVEVNDAAPNATH